MLVFDQFEIAPGARLNAHLTRGRLHGVVVDPAHVREDFVERYLADPAQARAAGELWLEELRDAEDRPLPLRRVPPARLRGFFARFVGFVLRDGGLLDPLTVRENLLLAFRYHEIWPRPPEMPDSAIAALLAELTTADAPGVAAPAQLDRRPAQLDFFACRYWGLVKTLLRRPQLVIVFAPFDGLGPAAQLTVLRLLLRYRALEPRSAILLVLTGVHESAVLAAHAAGDPSTAFLPLSP